MKHTPPAAHAAHDELLIARLFGGDVSDVERERALDVMGECSECADLFADLGAIADATESMPIPARPHDFSLTAADVARLSRRRWSRRRWSLAALARPGLRQSLGGALAALGLAGFILTGAATLLGGSGTSTNLAAAPQDRAAYQNGTAGGVSTTAASAGPAFAAAPSLAPGAASSPGSEQSPTPGAPESSAGASTPDGTEPPTSAAATEQFLPAAGNQFSSAPSPGSGTEMTTTDGTNGKSATDSTTSRAIDPRLVWLAGFALLFLIGLAVILMPWLIRRRGRRGRGART
jgi:hypothetical protein